MQSVKKIFSCIVIITGGLFIQNYLYGKSPTLIPTSNPMVTPSKSPSEKLVRASKRLGTGSILGTVTDELGSPISGAIVSLKSRKPKIGRSTETDINGKYEFLSLSRGLYTIVAENIGYSSEKRKVKLGKGTDKQVDFQLRTSSGNGNWNGNGNGNSNWNGNGNSNGNTNGNTNSNGNGNENENENENGNGNGNENHNDNDND